MIEEILKELTFGEFGFMAAMLTAGVFFIQQGSRLLFKTIETEVHFWQRNRHAKKKVDLDISIEEKKMKLEYDRKVKQKKLDNAEDTTLQDALKIQARLREIREYFSAQNVTISIYHNGVAKGFKNYSIRYEEPRSHTFSIIEKYQTKPLSPSYSTIDQFKKEEVAYYHVDDSINELNSNSITYLKLGTLEAMYVCAMLVPETEIGQENRIMKLKINDVNHYIIGVITVNLDKDSKSYEEQDKELLKNRVDDIINIYEKNPRVFG